jgi:hypothetical protein
MDAWKACACLLCMLVCGVPAAAGRRLQQVTWVVDTNISYEGNDLADARAPNANACSYLCLAYRGAAPCTAFTWSPAGMCWLKSAAAGSKAAEGFMSGRISGGPQPAATAAATAAAAVAVQAPTQPQPGAAEVAGPVAGPQAAPAPGEGATPPCCLGCATAHEAQTMQHRHKACGNHNKHSCSRQSWGCAKCNAPIGHVACTPLPCSTHRAFL